MPRLAPLRFVAAAALLIPQLACRGGGSALPVTAKSVLKVNITCLDGVSIGLTDASGASAWSVNLKRNDEIEWHVEDNITSIVISPKDPARWPLVDLKPDGGKKEKPAKSKVKGDAEVDKTYPYNIEAVCQRPNNSTIKITIDPDMIVLQ